MKDFGTIPNDFHNNTLLLKGDTGSAVTNRITFWILIDDKFVIGFYHKVDDSYFEVIGYHFPDNNVHSASGYKTVYSQLMRFYRLCNNPTDFLFRAKLIYHRLISRDYKHNLLRKSFMGFCHRYGVSAKYCESKHKLILFWDANF